LKVSNRRGFVGRPRGGDDTVKLMYVFAHHKTRTYIGAQYERVRKTSH